MAEKNIKLPPQNMEAEVSVIGSLMLDKNAVIKIADRLSSSDFYQPAHQKIYEAVIELFEKGEAVDILTISNKLKSKKILKEAGGQDYLAEILEKVPSSAHVEEYANIVRENRVKRDLIQASSYINEEVFGKKDFESLLDTVEQKIFGISQRSRVQRFAHIKDELGEAYERLEKLHHGDKSALRGIPTSFPQLDALLSGFQPSDLIILGARPSYGKTALVLDIARNAALKGFSVGIFSLEMSKDQIVDRMIAAQANVSFWQLRTGKLKDEMEFSMVQQALDEFSKTKLFIDDAPSPNILQMRSMARRLQIDHGLDLLVIDYLQLIQPRTGSDNMVQQVTEISRGIKALARELRVPVLAVSQLSRDVEKREVKVPRLSDLRESGSIEQEADVVMFLHRKDRERTDLPEEEQNLTEIIIAKHRNGPLGTVRLRFDPDRVCFRNIDETHSFEE